MSCKMIIATLVMSNLFLLILFYRNLRPQLEGSWRTYIQFKPPSNTPNPEMKTILLWTSWFQLNGWNINQAGYNWDGGQHTDLRDFGCDEESFKCTITSNRSFLEDESSYDAFLFHERDINHLDIPDQEKRMANQVYMFNTLEAPIHNQALYPGGNLDPSINNNFFNVTMTYSAQSDVHIPYGKIVKTGKHPTGQELKRFITTYGEENKRHVIPKNVSAVIHLSNCASKSQREKVITDLRGVQVPVDIFGACGAPSPYDQYDGTPGFWVKHMKLLGQTYQFFLAFENSICNDYITQRLFDVLHADMIPVVLNGANMSRIAPEHSYIDVKNFATIEELGNYLQKVSSDPALYSSYFWWRQYYEVQPMGKHFVKVFCEACRYIHSGKGPRIVEDLQKEWGEGNECRELDITFLEEEDIGNEADGVKSVLEDFVDEKN